MHSDSDVEEMRQAMADATATIPIADVRRLDVRPGDALMVRVPQRKFAAASADRMREQLLDLFGDDVKVVVMPDDIDVTVVRKALGNGEAGA